MYNLTSCNRYSVECDIHCFAQDRHLCAQTRVYAATSMLYGTSLDTELFVCVLLDLYCSLFATHWLEKLALRTIDRSVHYANWLVRDHKTEITQHRTGLALR